MKVNLYSSRFKVGFEGADGVFRQIPEAVEVGRVDVIYEGQGEDQKHQVQAKLTNEGLIIDLVDGSGEIVATCGYDVSEMEELCH